MHNRPVTKILANAFVKSCNTEIVDFKKIFAFSDKIVDTLTNLPSHVSQ